MNILIYPHAMELGGSQLNAIEIAGGLAERGHEVTVFGPDGPLVAEVERRGLTHVSAPTPKVRPSPTVVSALCSLVRERSIDVVHGFEWPPVMEVTYGPYLLLGTAAVGTVMSMSVAPFIPVGVPLTVGTARIAQAERPRRPDVALLEPPVDLRANVPGRFGEARAALGLGTDDVVVVIVSRLALELKREGILSAIRAVGALSEALPVRLVIAGDGPCRAEVEEAAVKVNAAREREVVTLLGEVGDPRGVYDAGDVILGMGGSALRGMAFGRPIVVQGELGYWRLLEPGSLDEFLTDGWYGIGGGQDGAAVLGAILRPLLADRESRARLGAFARTVVEDRFSLEAAAAAQERRYELARRTIPSRWSQAPSMTRSFGQVAGYELRRKVARKVGRAPSDDFNTIESMTRRTARSAS